MTQRANAATLRTDQRRRSYAIQKPARAGGRWIPESRLNRRDSFCRAGREAPALPLLGRQIQAKFRMDSQGAVAFDPTGERRDGAERPTPSLIREIKTRASGRNYRIARPDLTRRATLKAKFVPSKLSPLANKTVSPAEIAPCAKRRLGYYTSARAKSQLLSIIFRK